METTHRLRPSQFRYGDAVQTRGEWITVRGITFVRGGVRVDDIDGGTRVLNGRYTFPVNRQEA